LPTTKVDLGELVPPLSQFLGQAAYMELGVFESLAQAATEAPGIVVKGQLSRSAGLALAKHESLVDEQRRRGTDPAEAMAPFAADLDAFRRMRAGATWQESLIGCYLTAGLLDDFFASLATGLPGDIRTRIVKILHQDAGFAVIVHEITAAIAADPKLASSLALWGRRLVGDTLLIARSALHVSGDLARDESRIEPVFTEIIAAHTRRMDELGLTA
jgi:hypothetical protein